MNEFDKSQDKGKDTGEQGGKPAFGQFDKEQQEQTQEEGGQQIPEDRQQQQDQARKDELAGTTGQQGDAQDEGTDEGGRNR